MNFLIDVKNIMMKKINLIVVDCQYDFINPEGELYVKGAEHAVNNIYKIFRTFEVESVIFTADWHPITHCSFNRNDGIWPIHCLQHSMGASIDEELLYCCIADNIPYKIITKGSNPSKEEYGAFSNFEGIEYLKTLNNLMICGVAGDFCVLETIKNLVKNNIKPEIFLDGIASIDGGTKLCKYISENL